MFSVNTCLKRKTTILVNRILAILEHTLLFSRTQLFSQTEILRPSSSRTLCMTKTLHLVSEVGSRSYCGLKRVTLNWNIHKAQSKSSRGEPESLEVGTVDDAGVGATPSEETKDPVNMCGNAMMQICLQFQCDLGENLEKDTIKQNKRWWQFQIQVNIRDEMEKWREWSS